jgi:hypothetical protein
MRGISNMITARNSGCVLDYGFFMTSDLFQWLLWIMSKLMDDE